PASAGTVAAGVASCAATPSGPNVMPAHAAHSIPPKATPDRVNPADPTAERSIAWETRVAIAWLNRAPWYYVAHMEDVGRYRVTRRIGEGGMAEVFEGVAFGAGGFKRRVAIKRMLRERTYDAQFGRMFLDEARIASQLHHANIVAVLDYGMADAVPVQVLEYRAGPTPAR